MKKVYNQEIMDLFKYHIEGWKTVVWISEAIQVPINTLKWWVRKIKKWKELKDARFWNSTKQKKFSDEELKNYCDNNENATLKEIWKYFQVTDVVILKRLRTMKYSYKKKTWNIKKEMRGKEQNI